MKCPGAACFYPRVPAPFVQGTQQPRRAVSAEDTQKPWQVSQSLAAVLQVLPAHCAKHNFPFSSLSFPTAQPCSSTVAVPSEQKALRGAHPPCTTVIWALCLAHGLSDVQVCCSVVL